MLLGIMLPGIMGSGSNDAGNYAGSNNADGNNAGNNDADGNAWPTSSSNAGTAGRVEMPVWECRSGNAVVLLMAFLVSLLVVLLGIMPVRLMLGIIMIPVPIMLLLRITVPK